MKCFERSETEGDGERGKSEGCSRRSCSHCSQPGHTINKCKDQSIDILHQSALEATIFCKHVSSFDHERMQFMVMWLMTNHTTKELRILGYKNKCISKVESGMHFFLIEMSTIYLEIRVPYKLPPIEMLDAISDETIQKLAINFVKEVVGYKSIMGCILYILRPLQKQFNIETMMLCTETAKELKKSKECPICLSQEIKCISTITTNCQHTYCSPCLQGYFKSLNRQPFDEPKCALCRTQIHSLEFKDPELYEEITHKYCEYNIPRIIPEIYAIPDFLEDLEVEYENF